MQRRPSNPFTQSLTRSLAFALTLLCTGCHTMTQRPPHTEPVPADPRWSLGEPIYRNAFDDPSLRDWHAELEQGGSVRGTHGSLDIEVPAGATVWLRRELKGPLLITYEATAIDDGGPNDRVSDLNCFWMARDTRSPDDIFAAKRSGGFADYNELKTYYVGLGGNHNSTTRFRRYIGDPASRPILPEHDLSDPSAMLKPNTAQTVTLVASGPLIQYFRDGTKLFELTDPDPYTSGWFGFRTTYSHLRIDNLRVYALEPTTPGPE